MLIKKFYSIFICMLGYILSSCASTSVPSNWLPTPIESQEESYGAWIQVELNENQYYEGEFIAVSSDSVFVLSPLDLRVISINDIVEAKLTTYDSQHGTLGNWTLLGSLSTLSHGVGLILSLPVWLISGISATAIQSNNPIENYPQDEWKVLSRFARYPAGLLEIKNVRDRLKSKESISSQRLSKKNVFQKNN